MSDGTAEAIKALMDQVTALTKKVESITADKAESIKKLEANNQRLTDQLKDIQRQAETSPERARQLRAAGLKQRADGSWQLGATPLQDGGYTITREDARDPQKYRSAKAEAEKAGVPLVVVDPNADDPTRRNMFRRDASAPPKVTSFDFDGTRFMFHDAAHAAEGGGFVHRHDAARKAGLHLRTFRSVDDLPDAARTKFTLMESAANAESDS